MKKIIILITLMCPSLFCDVSVKDTLINTIKSFDYEELTTEQIAEVADTFKMMRQQEKQEVFDTLSAIIDTYRNEVTKNDKTKNYAFGLELLASAATVGSLKAAYNSYYVREGACGICSFFGSIAALFGTMGMYAGARILLSAREAQDPWQRTVGEVIGSAIAIPSTLSTVAGLFLSMRGTTAINNSPSAHKKTIGFLAAAAASVGAIFYGRKYSSTDFYGTKSEKQYASARLLQAVLTNVEQHTRSTESVLK